MKELLIKLCQNITGSISAVSGVSSCYWCNGNWAKTFNTVNWEL